MNETKTRNNSANKKRSRIFKKKILGIGILNYLACEINLSDRRIFYNSTNIN